MKTYVISVYSCCGRDTAIEKYIDKYKIANLRLLKYRFILRKRTEQELQEERDKWDSEPHLMSSEGYINRIKDQDIIDLQENYMEKYIDDIKSNLGKADFIFVDYDLEVRQALEDNNIEYICVCPSDNALNEWIGRMYLKHNKYAVDILIKNWDNIFIESEPHGKDTIFLKNDGYLSTHLDFVKYRFLLPIEIVK